jgi:ABC-type Zn uptake system ZnuABC Zn-binding protein ZnuA
MRRLWFGFVFAVFLIALAQVGAAPPASAAAPEGGAPKVLALESFLADLVQNIMGDRGRVGTLIPVGADPHGFEPAPSDVRKISDSDVLVINGAGFEEFLGHLMKNVRDRHRIIVASAGIAGRKTQGGEHAPESSEGKSGERSVVDPHFWLSPVNAIRYAENIRDGLSLADPEGAPVYAANTEALIERLKALDEWIARETAKIPPERRLLLTNHDSLGYFADRYGFTIIGTIIPGFSTEASPSAFHLALLIDAIKKTGAKAIFLETTGSNPHLAEQIGKETGARVVTELYTESLSGPDGPAATYIDMLKYDTKAMVDALE